MERKTRRAAAAVAIAASLTGGAAVGAVLGTPGTSGAQSPTTESTTSAPATTKPADIDKGTIELHGRGPGGIFGAGFELSVAADELGLTEEELRTRLDDGATLAEVAEAEGVDVDALIAKLVAAGKTAIDEAAADAKANLEDRVTEVVENGFPDHEGGPGFPGGGHHGGPGMGFGFADLSTAADALGLTEDELRTRLEDGDSLADVAKAEGVTTDALVKELVAVATAEIDERVAAGDLDEDQAADITDGLTERITSLVEDGFPGPWGHRPGR